MSEEGWRRAHRLEGFEDCFTPYIRWLLKRSFARVWVRRDALPLPRGGYVAVANHSSWWDGFVPYFLHRVADPKKAFAVLMSDVELRRFPFFRWAGAFSIDPSSTRAARASIRYAGAEAERGAGVWMFPQGTLGCGEEWMAFTSGFVHAARWGGVPIVPLAMRFAMRGGQRPEAFVDVGPWLDPQTRDVRDVAESTVLGRLGRIDRDIASGDIESRYVAVLRSSAGIDKRMDAALSMFRRCRS